MVLSWIRWLNERTAPKDPARRERYYRAWGVIGIAMIIAVVVRWIIAHW